MNTDYTKIKADLLAFGKKHHACKSEYEELYIADSIEDVIAVVKDNFEWCAKYYEDFANIIKGNEEQFAEHGIFLNKPKVKDYCNDFILYTEGSYELDLWFSTSLNVWVFGDTKLRVTLRSRSSLQILSHNKSNIEIIGYSQTNIKVTAFNDSRVQIRMYSQSYAYILAYDTSLVYTILYDDCTANLYSHGKSDCAISANNDSTAIVTIYDDSQNNLISNHYSTIIATCNDLFKDSKNNAIAYDNSSMIIKSAHINVIKGDETASLIMKF